MENKGATLNLLTGETNPKTGYMVSLPNREFSFDPLCIDFQRALKVFIQNNLNDLLHEGNYLGSWIHEGNFYLDVSVNMETLEDAIHLGNLNDQIAIWDCQNQSEIKL